MEISNSNSPNVSMHPIMTPTRSHSTSMISIVSSPDSKQLKNKTQFSPVVQKVLDELNQEDIQPEIEEEETKAGYFNSGPEEAKAGYFNPDPEEEEEDEATIIRKSRDRIANSAYEIYFKPWVFIKFFIMHFLFFFGLGPFIFILIPIFGKYILINQGFIGLNYNFFIQTAQYAALMAFLISYYLVPIFGLLGMEVYMVCIAVLVRIITISSKYAYQSENFLKLMHTCRLTAKDVQGDLILFGWRLQQDAVIEEELQAALLRLEIDSSLFFFNFIGKPSLKLKEALSKKKMIGRLTVDEIKTMAGGESSGSTDNKNNYHSITLGNNNSQREEETVRHRVQSGESTTRGTLLSERKETSVKEKQEKLKKEKKKKEKVSKSAQEIFKSFSHFLGTKKLERSHLYGYNLAFDLLKYVRGLRYKYLGTTLVLISLVRASIPTLYRLFWAKTLKLPIPIFTDRPFIMAILFLLNLLFFWFNIFILSIPILDSYSKTQCFKQIGYLISPRKITEFKDKKLYPTINIFDPVTLKTWSNFRKLMNSYGRKYTLRSSFNVTMIMTLYIMVFLTLILQTTGLLNYVIDPLLWVVLVYETIVFFVIFIVIMIRGAFINDQYRVHKNLLKKNKTIISDFHQLSHLYIGKEGIEPDNYIYKEGLRLLRAELGDDDDFQEKLVDRAEKLVTMIENIIEELEAEEENEPFTVLGIAITNGMLKTLGIGVGSLIFGLGQAAIGSFK